jgi:hypothetical protein
MCHGYRRARYGVSLNSEVGGMRGAIKAGF